MLQIFENAITDDELVYLREEFDKLKLSTPFVDQLYYIDHPDTIKEVYNLDDDKLIQQDRLIINNLPVGQFVKKLLTPYVEEGAFNNELWACRSEYPIGVHTDTDEKQPNGYTVLIPLTFDDRIKTIIWKPLLGKNELNKFMQDFGNNPLAYPIVNSISKELDLKHCWISNPSICDAMELDGYASWSKGSILKFDRRQPHASSNWKTYMPYKDYILIHAK